MGEYIDKAKLFEHFSSLAETYTRELAEEIRENKPGHRNTEGINARIDEAIKAKFHVFYMETEDVEPVIHSKWKYYKKRNRAVCMNCSFERNLDDNFGRAICCPNCGAKME